MRYTGRVWLDRFEEEKWKLGWVKVLGLGMILVGLFILGR